MKIAVTGKQIDVGSSLQSYVDEKLNSGLSKYFNATKIEASVTFSREAHLFRADCSVHLGRDIHMQSHGEASDIYVAFDNAADRLEKQLRRYKRRITDHHKRRQENNVNDWAASAYVIDVNQSDDEEHDNVDAWQPLTIAETAVTIPELSVGEAVMRMDLADEPVMMFRNSASGQFNVVFRRKDGNIGWIDPSNAKTGT